MGPTTSCRASLLQSCYNKLLVLCTAFSARSCCAHPSSAFMLSTVVTHASNPKELGVAANTPTTNTTHTTDKHQFLETASLLCTSLQPPNKKRERSHQYSLPEHNHNQQKKKGHRTQHSTSNATHVTANIFPCVRAPRHHDTKAKLHLSVVAYTRNLLICFSGNKQTTSIASCRMDLPSCRLRRY